MQHYDEQIKIAMEETVITPEEKSEKLSVVTASPAVDFTADKEEGDDVSHLWF